MTDDSVAVVTVEEVRQRCSEVIGRRPLSLTPDAVASLIGEIGWKRLCGWERWTDTEIAARSGLLGIQFEGKVFVVTEAAMVRGIGGNAVAGSEGLAVLVQEHLARFGECFFNGDVLVVDCAEPKIWMFHHEGLFAVVSGNPSEVF